MDEGLARRTMGTGRSQDRTGAVTARGEIVDRFISGQGAPLFVKQKE